MRNLHAEITAKILAQLKTGVAPWRKPWSEYKSAHGEVMPRNVISGRPYSGVNVVLLWSTAQVNGWGPRWLTFKQAKTVGGSVRKGEKGEQVIFLKRYLADDKENPGKKKSIGFLRSYTVFNVAQCDGLPQRLLDPVSPSLPVDRNARDPLVEGFVAATAIKVIEQGSRAAYIPALDRIDMPSLQAFKSSHAFYSTLFHEMGHATGHKDRLNRDLKGKFGDRAYAAEELIAELCSAFVCAEFGIDMEDAPAAYIDHWVSLLEAKETAVVSAASAASKATEWLRGAASAEEADEDEEPASEALKAA
jgi:antirestriction protein ArdC